MQRNVKAGLDQLDEVILGCANQAGEDNRNVARMAFTAGGASQTVRSSTVNRLCASGMEAIGSAARAIAAGEMDGDCWRRRIHVARSLCDGQGRDSVLAHRRDFRHHHRLALYQSADEKQYGVDSMPETEKTSRKSLPFHEPTRIRLPCAVSKRRLALRPTDFSPKRLCR
jgi:hypothetical protein